MQSLRPNAGPNSGEPGHRAVPLDEFQRAADRCSSILNASPAHQPVRRMFGPVSELAETARELTIPPERLLSTLKSLLLKTPMFQAFEISEREDATQELVTLAIKVFYAETAA